MIGFFLSCLRTPRAVLKFRWNLQVPRYLQVPTSNEQISQNPRRVAHCTVSVLVMVCIRSFAVADPGKQDWVGQCAARSAGEKFS